MVNFGFDFRKLIGPVVAAVVLALAATGIPRNAAADLGKPTGKVILTVGGKISETNVGDEARFDRAMLEEVGMRTLKTRNPFETGMHMFEGVLLSDLLRRVGATGETLVAYALDGYAIEIPVSDAAKYPVLLALIWNGKEMSVRNKGPIWVIYPVDEFEELKDEEFSSRSIWQLERIVVE
ncbi:MAG: molybdopterin-dependent oxidoreductase [Rhodospirillales bacterium]